VPVLYFLFFWSLQTIAVDRGELCEAHFSSAVASAACATCSDATGDVPAGGVELPQQL
jgi:hypothetical protein